MTNEVVRGYWASAYCNGDFFYVETWSGYRGGDRFDAKGAKHHLLPDANDDSLGVAVLDALAHSRWVLGAPREGSVYPADVEFDAEHYDYKLNITRYAAWIEILMQHYGYKTKRALFKDMKKCSIERKSGTLTISPFHHEKLEAWSGTGEAVVIPDTSTPAEIGAALRLALSRCTD